MSYKLCWLFNSRKVGVAPKTTASTLQVKLWRPPSQLASSGLFDTRGKNICTEHGLDCKERYQMSAQLCKWRYGMIVVGTNNQSYCECSRREPMRPNAVSGSVVGSSDVGRIPNHGKRLLTNHILKSSQHYQPANSSSSGMPHALSPFAAMASACARILASSAAF